MYIGLTPSSCRVMVRRPNQLWRSYSLLQRTISSTTSQKNWRNETPPGGLTEILVYNPESQIAWPDTSLGIFAQADQRFLFPGNVGVTASEHQFITEEAKSDDTTSMSKNETAGLVFHDQRQIHFNILHSLRTTGQYFWLKERNHLF